MMGYSSVCHWHPARGVLVARAEVASPALDRVASATLELATGTARTPPVAGWEAFPSKPDASRPLASLEIVEWRTP